MLWICRWSRRFNRWVWYWLLHSSTRFKQISHLRLDELGSDISGPLPSETTASNTTTPLGPTITLPSPTPSASGFANSYSIVIGAPSTIQSTATTPSVVVTKSPSAALPLMLVSLPGCRKLFDVFIEAALGVGVGGLEWRSIIKLCSYQF